MSALPSTIPIQIACMDIAGDLPLDLFRNSSSLCDARRSLRRIARSVESRAASRNDCERLRAGDFNRPALSSRLASPRRRQLALPRTHPGRRIRQVGQGHAQRPLRSIEASAVEQHDAVGLSQPEGQVEGVDVLLQIFDRVLRIATWRRCSLLCNGRAESALGWRH
jgi:hypothetical protein